MYQARQGKYHDNFRNGLYKIELGTVPAQLLQVDIRTACTFYKPTFRKIGMHDCQSIVASIVLKGLT